MKALVMTNRVKGGQFLGPQWNKSYFTLNFLENQFLRDFTATTNFLENARLSRYLPKRGGFRSLLIFLASGELRGDFAFRFFCDGFSCNIS
jgi:hypothetical protein